MGDVKESTITVPAAYVERFRHETLCVLGSAAQVIEEIARWSREANERDEPPKAVIKARDLQVYRDAETLFVEAHADTDGDLTVEGRASALHSAAIGCTLDSAAAIRDEADKRKPGLRARVGGVRVLARAARALRPRATPA